MKLNDFALYIPTKGRVTQQPTWDSIPAEWKPYTYIVCTEDEAEAHQQVGRNVLVRPPWCEQVAQARQWLVENGPEYVFMSDDDHTFYRRKLNDWHLQPATPEDISIMLDSMYKTLKEQDFHAVGLDARQTNYFHYPDAFVDNTRMNNFYGFRKSTLLRHNIRFDEFLIMEDFHVTLSLLELGYKNRVFCEWCWNQIGSNAAGGASIYRTLERQAECAHRLAKRHSPHVRVVERKAKSGWKGMETRTDVRIQWQKAFNSKRTALW